MTIYDYTVQDMQGHEVALEQYRGKALLITNTASKCGFTPQFEGLESLYQKYQERGLVILGFPCNQFGGQDPGSNDQILDFCVKNYGVSFPMHQKIDVNGSGAHPLFDYLKKEAKGALGTSSPKTPKPLRFQNKIQHFTFSWGVFLDSSSSHQFLEL